MIAAGRGACVSGAVLAFFTKVIVFLAAQQHAFRLLLQEDVEVGEGDVDFPRGTLGRRGWTLGRQACARSCRGKHD